MSVSEKDLEVIGSVDLKLAKQSNAVVHDIANRVHGIISDVTNL